MKKLLVLSGKGGTGKTTLVAAFIDFLNVSAFADCDVDAPNLHLVAKMEVTPEYNDYFGSQKAYINPEKCIGCGVCVGNCRFDSISLLNGRCEVDEYACEGCGVCRYVCSQNAVIMRDDVAGEQMLYRNGRVFSTAKLRMGRGNSGKLVSEVKTALIKAAPACGLAIIDGSPGVGCPVIASVSGVDLVLVVTEPSLSGIHDMKRVLKTADILRAKAVVCVNKYDNSIENTDLIENYCFENNVPFVGRIPYDKRASGAINAGHSLAFVDCSARDALKLVLGNTIKLLDKQETE